MSEVRLIFEAAGLMTTVQDSGRFGHQGMGIPSGGPMDRGAARRANWLVGNPLGGPVLEITLAGPKIRFSDSCIIALAGADLSPLVNGVKVQMDESISVVRDSILTFGRPVAGCRSYLSVGGDWCIPTWLGSVSTAVTDSKTFTPMSAIDQGSEIVVLQTDRLLSRRLASLELQKDQPIRLVKGPEMHLFSRHRVADFLNVHHQISAESNRMGFRLESSTPLRIDHEMVSSGTVPGTIQAPPSGHPIILMADAQTSGGYPRFAVVATVDLDVLAQKRPGEKVRFQVITADEALRLYRDQMNTEQKLFGS